MDGVHSIQVIAVASGKGGVGKTTVAVNLSFALAKCGRRVVLLDGDLGLANIDVLLGLAPTYTLADLIEGRCVLSDVLMRGPGGVRIVPAASGVENMVNLSSAQHTGLIQAFSDISDSLDVLVIDTATGLGKSMVSFARAAQDVLLVVCDDPASIADTYALIRLLNRDYGMSRFRILASMVHNLDDGRRLFGKLNNLADRFLDVSLHYAGAVPYDECVRKAGHKQRAVSEVFPNSKSACAFNVIAQKVDAWSLPSSPRGHIEFFIDKLVSNSKR
ncbi:MAG: MinD/ParA family protein [Pseudomonas taetrolens]|uniref:MinD/ParA family protein n=1 Tax=Pseudomonas taetrolens TaxID=47884 RepID=UPI003F983957